MQGWKLNYCGVCGEQLAPDDFDGICSGCDAEEDGADEMSWRFDIANFPDRILEIARDPRFARIVEAFASQKSKPLTDAQLATARARVWQGDDPSRDIKKWLR